MPTHLNQLSHVKRFLIACIAIAIICMTSWIGYTISHSSAASGSTNTSNTVNTLLFGQNLILNTPTLSGDQFGSSAYRATLQNQLHVGAVRIPARGNAQGTSTVTGVFNIQAVIAATQDTIQMGAIPLIIMRSPADANMLYDDGTLLMDPLMHAIDATNAGKNATIYVEFGNEPNLHGVSPQQYVTGWNKLIPVLKAKTYANQLKFVGPAVNQFSGQESFLQTFLNGVTSATLPDVISWHEYPCTSTPDPTGCATQTTHWLNHITAYRQMEKQVSIIHSPLPIWITEYNYSSGSSPDDSNKQFQQQWSSQAIQSFAKYGVTAAFHYDVGPSDDLADNNGNLMAEGLGMQDAYNALAAGAPQTPVVTTTCMATATDTSTATNTTTATSMNTATTTNIATTTATSAATCTPSAAATCIATSTSTSTVTATATATDNLTTNCTPIATETSTATASATVADTATATPISTTTSTSTSVPVSGLTQFSFEDGQTDGWTGSGNVTSLTNSTDIVGQDGSHELKGLFSSRSSSDYPYISVGTENGPHMGQILSAYVYVPKGGGASVNAKLFIQDDSYSWHQSSMVTVSTGAWIKLTYIVPFLSGGSNRIGIQVYGNPNNTSATMYIDAIGWG